MNDCVFCKIAAGEIPSNRLYEDDTVLAFYDIQPKAPVHFLVIPKRHIAGVAAITEAESGVVGHIFEIIPRLAARLGLKDFRVVSNNGEQAGQTVHHLHFHVLAGRDMGEMG